LVLSEIDAKLAGIQTNLDSLTSAGTDIQSIKTAVRNMSINLSAELDEFKGSIATPGQGLSVANLLEEFKGTTKDCRVGIDGLSATAGRISQLVGDVPTAKGLKDMADKIRGIYDMVNGVSIRTDYIDTKISGMEEMLKNVENIVGGTGMKMESLLVNQDNAAIQRPLTATTLTAMEWTKALISDMERMQASIEKIERLTNMHSKQTPATKNTKNAAQQLESSICTVEAKLGEIREIEVAMNSSFSRLEDSMKLRIKGLEEKVDGSTKKVEKSVQQNMGKLAIDMVGLTLYIDRGQRNIQSAIGQMEGQMNARLGRIEEASLKKVEKPVPTESTKEQMNAGLCRIEEAPLEKIEKPVPTEPTREQRTKSLEKKWGCVGYIIMAEIVYVRNQLLMGDCWFIFFDCWYWLT